MNKKEIRTSKLLELLTKEEKIEVSKLSEMLGVSQVTIRKDLDSIQSLGIIKREHGFALLSSANDIQGRLAYHYEEKCKIAKNAAEFVNNGSTIMIESGSCCALLASELIKTKKNLTIITNSLFIANYIRSKSNFQIILLGGIFQQDSQVMVGPMVRQCAENFFVDMFFIGIDGYSSKTGFTNNDQMRAQAVNDMAGQTEKIIILTESEKFKEHGIVPLKLSSKVTTLITDSNISKTDSSFLTSKGISIITV